MPFSRMSFRMVLSDLEWDNKNSMTRTITRSLYDSWGSCLWPFITMWLVYIWIPLLYVYSPGHTLHTLTLPCTLCWMVKWVLGFWLNNGKLKPSQHILIWSLTPEIRSVAEGKASGIKYLAVHGWAYFHSRLCGCCRPASGHAVKGVSERGPAINLGPPHQIQNRRV